MTQAVAANPCEVRVHGSGSGHDQRMDWAAPLAQRGIRVIAMSRFGYLRAPRPGDASPEAAVIGVSAGGGSSRGLRPRETCACVTRTFPAEPQVLCRSPRQSVPGL